MLLVLQACATNPISGRPELAMSEGWEKNAGAKYHQEILKQYQVYDNPELQEYINDIGQRLAKKSHRPDLQFTFTLLDSPDVNAFALPGGYVYVTRGIMAYMNKESHLAGVIGHEIGHVTGRHGAQRAAQQQVAQAATVAVAIGTGSGELIQASQMLGGALMSGYGRNQELQSDRLGAEYIAQNNYAPEDMIEVISILKNQELFAKQRANTEGREVQAYHGLFSTHPQNDQRLQEVIKAAEKFRDLSQASPDDGRFLRLSDGLAFGESETQGITRGNKFYHKSLNLFVEFPAGWKIQNTQSVLGALSADGTQVIKMQMDSIAPPVDPAGYLSSKFQSVSEVQSVATSEDQAFAGIASAKDPKTGQQQRYRVSTVTRGDQAFVMTGLGKTQLPNKTFFDTTKSIRKLKPSEISLAEGRNIKLVTARRGDTIASLAKSSNLDKYAEAQIRLMNDLYPRGEPKIGQLIKIIN
ncbi:MAG: putative Zn-dependent protease [Arenicella sp.]|jgi:predicted Zn-dependent protease